jgi:NAD(P)-dependent dehydrogenase (short-subunit alcohol dehydrogenase family)
MRDLAGRTAVVTGGASGIGLGLARALAAEGMTVVIADIEEAALAAAVTAVADGGATASGVVTDVSDPASVDALAEQVERTHGPVHLLANNAGVSVHGPVWALTVADWQWLLGVNLWGVVNGLRSFVPRMLVHGQPGHIVNTASYLGVTTRAHVGPYSATKHAVMAISESLALDLRAAGSAIGVSVIIPKGVATNIYHSARNRPARLAESAEDMAEKAARRATVTEVLGAPLAEPDAIARTVVEGIKADRFYLFTHPGQDEVRARIDAMLAGEQPRG